MHSVLIKGDVLISRVSLWTVCIYMYMYIVPCTANSYKFILYVHVHTYGK